MEEIADVEFAQGPSMIRDENGLLAGYVYVDFDTSKIDVGTYVEPAKAAVKSVADSLPPATADLERPVREHAAGEGAAEGHPALTLVLIFGLLYMNTKCAFKASIVMLAVPFSAIGAVWLLWLLGYNVSIAVWVGLIALMGLDAETGVFMLLFLDLSHDECQREGRLKTKGDLVEAIIHGAVKRVRPKAMTVFAAFMGLLPIMWSTGTGADVMKRIAAPMVGGLVTSFLLELLVYPAVYFLWRRREGTPGERKQRAVPEPTCRPYVTASPRFLPFCLFPAGTSGSWRSAASPSDSGAEVISPIAYSAGRSPTAVREAGCSLALARGPQAGRPPSQGDDDRRSRTPPSRTTPAPTTQAAPGVVPHHAHLVRSPGRPVGALVHGICPVATRIGSMSIIPPAPMPIHPAAPAGWSRGARRSLR